jgi:hypothetical protein
MKCEKCGEEFFESPKSGDVSEKQIVARGKSKYGQWFDAFCWTCTYLMRFVEKDSTLQRDYERGAEERAQKHAQDVIRNINRG